LWLVASPSSRMGTAGLACPDLRASTAQCAADEQGNTDQGDK
jgi:hypothetical protein